MICISDYKYDADGNVACTWYDMQDINKHDADADWVDSIQRSTMLLELNVASLQTVCDRKCKCRCKRCAVASCLANGCAALLICRLLV